MTRPILMALALSAGLSAQAFAQTDTTKAPAPVAAVAPVPPAPMPLKGLTVLGIVSLPQGEFGDEDEMNYKTGFGVGAEFAIPLKSSPNRQVMLGAYYVRNSPDLSDAEDYGYEFSEEGEFSNTSIMAGLRVVSTQDLPGFYVMGLAGLNFTNRNNFEYYDPDMGGEATESLSSETSFAFMLGAGKKFGPLDISVRYVNMGEPKFTGKYEDEFGDTGEGKVKFSISMINFTVGYNF